jgi:hypothetical protein
MLVASNGPFGVSPEGTARLVMCIAPLYLLAARLHRELLWTLGLLGSAMLAAIVQAIFNTGGWAS